MYFTAERLSSISRSQEITYFTDLNYSIVNESTKSYAGIK